MHRPIKVGVSSCLLGEQVRYDGGHKHDLVNALPDVNRLEAVNYP